LQVDLQKWKETIELLFIFRKLSPNKVSLIPKKKIRIKNRQAKTPSRYHCLQKTQSPEKSNYKTRQIYIATSIENSVKPTRQSLGDYDNSSVNLPLPAKFSSRFPIYANFVDCKIKYLMTKTGYCAPRSSGGGFKQKSVTRVKDEKLSGKRRLNGSGFKICALNESIGILHSKTTKILFSKF